MHHMVLNSGAPTNISLWHHKLAHTPYSTLEGMEGLCTTEGFMPDSHLGPIALCSDCPYGKQIHTLFQKTENLPENIGNIIVLEICSPFDISMAGYKYFIT